MICCSDMQLHCSLLAHDVTFHFIATIGFMILSHLTIKNVWSF